MNELIDPQNSLLTVKDSDNKEFVASSLTVSEQLSAEYQWTVDVLVTHSQPADWIGLPVSCLVYQVTGSSRSTTREFQGYVIKAQVQSQRIDSTYYSIKLTVEPWINLLKYSRQCRVFQEATTQTIVTSIFDELGFKGAYSVKSMPSTKREYCVQFNESDYDFVTRLLAEDGVHFYFGKDSKAGTLYLQQASKPFASDDQVTVDYTGLPSGEYDVLETWQREHAFHSASVELAAYDYNQSKLVTSKAKATKYSVANNTKLKEYRYPSASMTGAYTDLASTLAVTQRGQLDSSYDKAFATTNSQDVCVGHYLKLAAHPESSQQGNYLVSELTYHFDEGKGALVGNLVCVPEDQDFYPTHKAKPVIHGLQSATVAGSKDGEASNDTLGRVRIKFHWDPETGDKTSCWIRVAQPLAGNGYGMQFIPRTGQEVLVSFINGDPDQPVIVSSVYNSSNKPPYPVANTTQSGVITKLTGESNELRFDDKKDNESIYMHAAKDFTSAIVNDHVETVGGEMKLTVTKNIAQAVEQSFALKAKEGVSLATEKSYDLKATEAIKQEGKEITLTASDSLTLKVGDSKIVMSSDKIELSTSKLTLSGDSSVSVDGGSIKQSGSSVSISSDGSLSAKAGSSMSLSATSSFTAKASSSAKVQGLNAELKGDVSAKVSGAATSEISSSGQTAVKGTLVMVN